MNKKILIVEDDGHLRRQYLQALSEFGDITQAINSKDALSMISKSNFDLLVLDNKLIRDPNFRQDIAGFYILKNVRKVLELDTPAILITAYGKIADNIDVEAEVSNLDNCCFMEKPAKLDVLKRKVEEILCPSSSPVEINEINNKSLWNWMNEKEQLQVKDYHTEKPAIKQYFIVINKLADNYIKGPAGTVFKNLINNSKYLDWILYLTEKRYRNHFEHQFNVGALGWYLLDVEVEKDMTLREKILDTLTYNGKHWTAEQLDSSWWGASLLHDHAYPIAYLFEAAFPMRTFLTDDSNEFSTNMRDILDSYNEIYGGLLAPKLNALFIGSREKDVKDSLKGKIAQKLLLLQMEGNNIDILKPDPYDHGVLGAANIASHLERIKINHVIREALIAIAFHNNPHVKNISIGDHPISFLLILCDQLQEWNRVIIRNDKCLSEFDNILLNLYNSDTGNLSFPERLKVRFEYNDEKILKETGWNYDLFLKSKKEHIGRLVFPKSFNPKGIDIEVLVSHQLDSYQNPV